MSQSTIKVDVQENMAMSATGCIQNDGVATLPTTSECCGAGDSPPYTKKYYKGTNTSTGNKTTADDPNATQVKCTNKRT